MEISQVRNYDKTENGTPIIQPGQETSKDLFLKLLVAQMTNQDPFNPQDPTQYITQLAQFNTLEQMMTLNDGMEYLVGMGSGILVNSALSSATNLIGKNVEAYDHSTTEGEEIKTIKGTVESVHIKDGIVYMDIKLDETGEIKTVEYNSFIRVSK